MPISNILVNNSADLTNLNSKLSFDNVSLLNSMVSGAGVVQDIESKITQINTTLDQLTFVQNQLNTYNNLNQETLLKQQKLLKMENNTLMNQLKELESIQSIIINKNRMIEQTEQNIKDQQNNIYLLILCALLGIVLMVSVFLNGYGIIKPSIFKIAVIAIVVIYIIIFIYYYNIFYFKTALSYLSDRKLQRINDSLKNWKSVTDANIQQAKYGDKSKWIANNCSCPPAEEQDYPSDTGNTIQQSAGHYYYDGNAPQHLLVPTPTVDNSTIFKEQIDWPDYTASGPNFYNSINPNNTENIIRNDLNEEEYSLLVGNTTYTNSL